ncbi:hypothetical protein BD410DRAFT_801389 [Rickenella mellea]|uniref:Uncharacterized protein n=1 Tax=Rickenella mellea TaxID=50990 RepID=A0A4Y7QE45_9AGAM|nr:hypothetical protein BD410DRAFT_801389 [Rickenella mellea]
MSPIIAVHAEMVISSILLYQGNIEDSIQSIPTLQGRQILYGRYGKRRVERAPDHRDFTSAGFKWFTSLPPHRICPEILTLSRDGWVRVSGDVTITLIRVFGQYRNSVEPLKPQRNKDKCPFRRFLARERGEEMGQSGLGGVAFEFPYRRVCTCASEGERMSPICWIDLMNLPGVTKMLPGVMKMLPGVMRMLRGDEDAPGVMRMLSGARGLLSGEENDTPGMA